MVSTFSQHDRGCRAPLWWASCWVLCLVCLPSVGAAQEGASRPLVLLRQNFPNPFTTRTAIPFEILPRACAEGRLPVVTIQILNVLVQKVASPTLRDSTGARLLTDLELNCGRYLAFWDRRFTDDGQGAAVGSYFYRIYLDGESQAIRLMQVREPLGPTQGRP